MGVFYWLRLVQWAVPDLAPVFFKKQQGLD